MNPWFILAGLLALVAAYGVGRNDGKEFAQAEHRKIELAQEAARKEQLEADAEAVAKIDVKNVTIQGKVIERIRTEQVYSDCKHSPESWKLIQEAYQ